MYIRNAGSQLGALPFLKLKLLCYYATHAFINCRKQSKSFVSAEIGWKLNFLGDLWYFQLGRGEQTLFLGRIGKHKV